MRIKKIDFQHDKGESYDIYYAVLPVGHDARVELTCESKDTLDGNECWSWEIDTEHYTSKCGVAKNKELAMEACQAAWEKMVMSAFEPTIKPLSWAEQDGNTVAYGANNMGFIIEKGSDGYIILTSPEQQYTKSHFGFETIEDAKAWCERYNKDLVEEAREW